MSTRGLYTFRGETDADSWNVYKHHDSYPTGAAGTLQTALKYFAWNLPRYESDEFAAAFCAAAKADYYVQAAEAKTAKEREEVLRYTVLGDCHLKGGGARFMPQGEPLAVALSNCSDIEYRYEIYPGNDGKLRVRSFAVSAWEAPGSETLLGDCLFTEFTPENVKEAAE